MNTPKPPRMTSQPRPDAIDPQLECLLDRALAPDAPPADLADRIARTTSAQLPRHRRATPILARLGLASPWRLAASIAFAAMLIWAVFTTTTPPPTPPTAPTAGTSTSPTASSGRTSPATALNDQEHEELIAALAASEGVLFPQTASTASNGDTSSLSADSDAEAAEPADPLDALIDTFDPAWSTDTRVF